MTIRARLACPAAQARTTATALAVAAFPERAIFCCFSAGDAAVYERVRTGRPDAP